MAKSNPHLITRSSVPITVIIPAYNEADRIGTVLQAASQARYVTKIVVVDDGSEDATPTVVRRWQSRDDRIHLLQLEENQGKAGAINAGAEHAAGDIVVLLDADLSGVEPLHIERLVRPVRRGQCAMTMGLFQNGRPSTDVMHRYLPFLSGQRCLRWSLFKDSIGLPNAGWSLETALNLHAWFYGFATQEIPWHGVTHAMRPEKQPGLRGYFSHVIMWLHIIRYALSFGRSKGPKAIVDRLQHDRAPGHALPSRRRNRSEPARRPLH
ncbi:MAG: glycosyltransferase family 2 protein [Chloroflexota bacterium]